MATVDSTGSSTTREVVSSLTNQQDGSNTIKPAATGQQDVLTGLNADSFLKLIIAQLQNQDPLNPTDNNQFLQQVSEIRNITATDTLTTTLDAVRLGQNVSSASALIGKKIDGLDDDGNTVSGVVEKAVIVDSEPKLVVGGKNVSLKNIKDIVSDAS